MSADLVILDGTTYFISELNGDIRIRRAEGLVHGDVRHLSTWELTVDGAPLEALASEPIEHQRARIFCWPRGGVKGVLIRRDRLVADGVHEDVEVQNLSEEEVRIRLRFRFGSDFADIFQIQRGRQPPGRLVAELASDQVLFRREGQGIARGTRIQFEPAPTAIGKRTARFDVALPPRGTWRTCVDVVAVVGNEERPARIPCRAGGERARPQLPVDLNDWLDQAPRLESDWGVLARTYRQSLLDLGALRFRPRGDMAWAIPAGGLPWFMALFGRDALVTAYELLPFEPRLARTTLEALAALQASGFDDFRDAEPGKILHELRFCDRAVNGDIPQHPYYGTHDATLLYLILLDEYERWTGDRDFVAAMEPTARRALEWMRDHGDPDQDGYLEYRSRSPGDEALTNHCWKDSDDSILFSDGKRAEAPIATCEIQGYAYDARRRAARLAGHVWGDDGLARRLEDEADELFERFNRDFWSEEGGHYVLALDADKRQVDSMTSNVGHLLWSGIVPHARAARVMERLMEPDMFTGWGLRTMSRKDAGFSPIAYHNGTVWPHDTALAAEGMRRYGFRYEAAILGLSLIEAAPHFGFRLPECFAGAPREATEIPIRYPEAASPQAWSAGAPMLVLRTLLGMDVADGELRSAPTPARELHRIELRGVWAGGRRRTVSGTAQSE